MMDQLSRKVSQVLHSNSTPSKDVVDISMDSDSRDEERNSKKVNLDICQLEMLRDILTYKA